MEEYGSYLVRTIFLMVKDRQLAEEIVQDAFVKAYQKINQLQEKEKLKSWLMTIAINLCRSRLRRKQLKLLTIDESDGQWMDEREQTPEQHVLILSKFENLTAAIMTLEYKYREVVTLHYFNEYSITEISRMTKTKENTVKSRLARARKQLYGLLVEEEVWDG